jgi:hypothetical protein
MRGWLEVRTVPAMLLLRGTAVPAISGDISPEVALNRSSRVYGSSSKIEAVSALVKLAASVMICFSKVSRLVVEFNSRLTSNTRASLTGLTWDKRLLSSVTLSPF